VTGTSQLPKVGVVFRPQLPPERLRDCIGLAESAGLDDVWLWEDCFAEGGLTTAAAALAWSGSLRIGLGLMPVPMRNPALAAMEVATLARLFPGRFIPAAGHGAQDWMEQIGGRVPSPVTLLSEWVTAVRSLLHGQAVTVSGRYVRLNRVALDWPPAVVPPLLVGARGPRTLALAGELADGLVLDADIEPGGVRQAVATAAARGPHEVVAYVSGQAAARTAGQAGTAPGAAQLPGEPELLAGVIRAYAEAGATTVVFEPAAGDPDPAPTIRLAAAARAVSQDARLR
jgi:alkanesulfonate monooxygenase SsuD/methylene tetrahydromethanopterin reductase-like flavin-dependent oxidoreductase (luciferase family)